MVIYLIVGAFFIACAYYLGKVVWAITFFTFHPSLKWGGKGKENNRKKEMFYAFILFFILYDSFLSESFLISPYMPSDQGILPYVLH